MDYIELLFFIVFWLKNFFNQNTISVINHDSKRCNLFSTKKYHILTSLVHLIKWKTDLISKCSYCDRKYHFFILIIYIYIYIGICTGNFQLCFLFSVSPSILIVLLRLSPKLLKNWYNHHLHPKLPSNFSCKIHVLINLFVHDPLGP